MRGKRPELVDAAVRSALRETVFRFELVLRINVTAYELLEREALIDAALSAHISSLVSEDEKARLVALTYTERFATYRDLLVFRVSELHAGQEARTIAESRYLDGHATLFSDVVDAWDEQVKRTQALADTTARLAELDGVPPAPPQKPDALSLRTAELVADLVEPAKSDALEKLGEGDRATGIATAWVRAKLAPRASVTADVTSPAAP
jgi:hypothetical protein